MGIGFEIFLYGFLAMVASILIYNLVRLFRSIRPAEYDAEKLLPQQVETKTEVEGKPKGFWRRFWDNVGPNEKVLNPHRFWKRHWDEERKETDMMYSSGILPSSIYHRSRDDSRTDE